MKRLKQVLAALLCLTGCAPAPAPAPRAQERPQREREPSGREEHPLHRVAQRLFVGLLERAEDAEARVVHQHVAASEARERRGHGSL